MMKRNLLSLFFCLAAACSWAEDYIQVVPFQAATGVTENDYDEALSFDLAMVNSHSFTALQMELYLPEGMTLQTGNEVWDCNSARFDGITKKGIFLPYHTINVDEAADNVPGHYHITMYDEDLGVIKGNDGWLLRFYYLTSEDMKPGYYPIKVSDVVLGIDGDTGIYPETSVSFVKVGNPCPNAFLDLGTLAVPSFVESALPATNVIHNGVCNNMVLTDGSTLQLPYSFKAKEASYTRQMANKWGTVCLPFDVTSDENVTEYYYITEVNDDELVLEKQHTILAGTPAIACKRGEDGIVANATNVQVSTVINNHDYFVGNYTQDCKVTDPDSYYIKENQFWRMNEWFYCDAFRSYLSIPQTNVKAFRMGDDTDTDIVKCLTGTSSVGSQQIYDMEGRRLSDLKPGINIIRLSDGTTKKITIKVSSINSHHHL